MTAALAIPLVLGAASAGLAAHEANEQNKAAKRAGATEQAIQDAAARQRQEITAKRLQELEGSIRSSSAGRGVAGSAVETSLLGSTFSAAQQESSNIEMNRFFQNLQSQSSVAASFQSPLAAGVGGFGTGFGLGSSFGGPGGTPTPRAGVAGSGQFGPPTQGPL